jgi:hypothetical protein
MSKAKSQLLDTRTRKSCALHEDALVRARELVVDHKLPWPA